MVCTCEGLPGAALALVLHFWHCARPVRDVFECLLKLTGLEGGGAPNPLGQLIQILGGDLRRGRREARLAELSLLREGATAER